MAGSFWQIIEAESFERGVAKCGGHRVVEEAIAPVKLGISRNPQEFIKTHIPGIYLAKTRLHWQGPEIVLSYSIWFYVWDEHRIAELRWIEWTDPDNDEWSAYERRR